MTGHVPGAAIPDAAADQTAHRKATGQRGDLQRHASGFGRADFLAAHDAAASAAANAAETAPAAS